MEITYGQTEGKNVPDEASRLKLACGVCLRDSKKADQRERREGERATQRLGTETCARPCIRVWT